jgi:hypothetical protein
VGAVGEDIGKIADPVRRGEPRADHGHRIGGIQQGAHGRSFGRHVVDAVSPDRDDGGAFRQLDAPDQGSGAAILGQGVFGR